MNSLRPYPLPANDNNRSAVVNSLGLDARKEDPFFEHVIAMVRETLNVPVALITLVSGDQQVFLARDGVPFDSTPRNMSLCAFTVAAKKSVVFPNALEDPRTRHHPAVADGGPAVRYYAGAPVILRSGFCPGAVCGIDFAPQSPPTAAQMRTLEHLAAMVARFYEVPLEPNPAHAQRLYEIAQDAQSEFLSLIGHELRTPLNGIHGMAQVLEPQTEEEAEVQQCILSSSEHLFDVVRTILTFTELQSGDQHLDDAEVNLCDILSNAQRMFSGLFRHYAKSIAFELPSTPVRIRGDRARLDTALTCLVANALGHGGSNTVLRVFAEPAGGAVVEVIDDGNGIAPEREAQIWSAFAIGNRVQDRTVGGLGLGLPLTRRIVEMHGGELHMINQTGALAVRIYFPAYRNA